MTFIKIGLSFFAVSLLSASSADTIYAQKCASCHGMNGDQKAMGTSREIKEMTVEEIEKSITDIASGKKKSMAFVKSIKENFMKKYTKEELHEVATYIHDLK